MTNDQNQFHYNGESFTKGEMAEAYCITRNVLQDWLDNLNIERGKEQYLAPKVIRILIEIKGEPNWNKIARVRMILEKKKAS